MVGWPRGEARDCKSLYTGSNPVPTSIDSLAREMKWLSTTISELQLHIPRTIGSAVEHHIDIVGVTGSIPVSSTAKSIKRKTHRHINDGGFSYSFFRNLYMTPY